jgi:hypothetical protein
VKRQRYPGALVPQYLHYQEVHVQQDLDAYTGIFPRSPFQELLVALITDTLEFDLHGKAICSVANAVAFAGGNRQGASHPTLSMEGKNS